MVWKSHEWKRAVEKLQNRYRLLAGELFSTVSDEKARISRLELEGQLKSLAISAGSKDKKEARGDFV